MLPTPKDPKEENAIADIRRHGFHIVNVFEEDGRPNFAYTVGLWHSYRHPEAIIFGLKPAIATSILNEVGRRIKNDGERLSVGQHYDGFIKGVRCVFSDVPKHHYQQTVTWDLWLYDGVGFPVIQCVWPTSDGVFPWDDAATEEHRKLQPVLASVPLA